MDDTHELQIIVMKEQSASTPEEKTCLSLPLVFAIGESAFPDPLVISPQQGKSSGPSGMRLPTNNLGVNNQIQVPNNAGLKLKS